MNPSARLARSIDRSGYRDVTSVDGQRVVAHPRGARHRHIAGAHAQIALLEKSGVIEIGP